MADLIATKATFPKSGGLAVADGAVSVNAGNGLHVNQTTGMVEVPVDTTAGLGYGSNGLEVEVDDSTIGFNERGQLQTLGGGGNWKPFIIDSVGKLSQGTQLGNFVFYDANANGAVSVCGFYCDNCVLVNSLQITGRSRYSKELVNVFNRGLDAKPRVNAHTLTTTPIIVGVGSYVYSSTESPETSPRNAPLAASFAGYQAGALLSFISTVSIDGPTSISLNALITWEI